MTCEDSGDAAVFCLDFENAKALAAQLRELWGYVDAAEARCKPEGTQ